MKDTRYPLFVAELSGNHHKSFNTALQLVRAAKDAGADAIKVQTFTPECLTMNSDREDFRISDPNSLWHGRTLYNLYKETMLPWEYHKPIFRECRKLGMIPFSTPFSLEAVDFLTKLQVTMFKVASFEITHTPLLIALNRTKKPVLLSTGVASHMDIAEACEQLYDSDVTLLKCTSEYPAKPEDANLWLMQEDGRIFRKEYGLSDHTLDSSVAVAATVLGASVIEKHLKLDGEDGPDSAFSVTPKQFAEMVQECKKYSGIVRNYEPPKRSSNFWLRRSVYIVKDIMKGEKFTEENLKVVRPNRGTHPSTYHTFIGRFAQEDYPAGTPARYEMLDSQIKF